MKKKSRLTAAFVALGFVLAGTLSASAEILTVCGKPADRASAAGADSPPLVRLAGAVGLEDDAGPGALPGQSQIALFHDASGYDLVVDWGEETEHSLRAAGAKIAPASAAGGIVHLVVGGPFAGLEHFLFSLDNQGYGELVWSGVAAGGDPDSDAVTTRSVCVKS